MRKHPLPLYLTTAALLFATTSAPISAQESLGERTREALETLGDETRQVADKAGEAIREGWKEAKTYLTLNPTEYRTAVEKRLGELGGEIGTLETEMKGSYLAERAYYVARVAALRPHVDFAQQQLATLPDPGPDPENPNEVYKTSRESLDNTISNLEGALNQAQRELSEGA